MPAEPSPMPPLILASTSRYRRELLDRLRLPYQVQPPQVDETPLPGEAPAALAERLALAKARAVAALQPQALVIGSDQVVELDGRALGKPGDHARAVEQLRAARGRILQVHTALAVVGASQVRTATSPVTVRLADLSDAAIERYLRLEQPYDCAGAIKSEALGIALIADFESRDPTALVGLPLIALVRLLRQFGVDVLEHAR
jgi:septum formation protein